MKTFKRIIMNLILVLMLTILANGVVKANTSVSAKIEGPGKVGFYDADGKKIMKDSDFLGKLGLDSSWKGNHSITLKYNGRELDSVSTLYTSGFLFWKDSYAYFPLFINFDENMKTLIVDNSNSVLVDYYNTVKNNGDQQLTIEIMNNGRTISIPISKPNGNEEYPFYFAITGTKDMAQFNSYGNEVDEFEDFIDANTEAVVNGTLIVPPNKGDNGGYVDFKVPTTGVYYVYKEQGENSGYGITMDVYAGLGGAREGILAKAGRLTGRIVDGKQEGVYMHYSAELGREGSYTSCGNSEGRANCYPLVAGRSYRVYNDSKVGSITVKFTLVDSNMVEICNEYKQENVFFQSDHGAAIEKGYIIKNTDDLFKSLSELIARFIRTLANGLSYLVHSALSATRGESVGVVDIDTILFNHYPDTSINFFASRKVDTGDSSLIITNFRDNVNEWYNVFKNMAIAGYLIILLYLGVKILLRTGGSKQAEYKQLLLYWVTGLIILAFFPYVIKYAIDLNNALVKMIEDSKIEVLHIPNTSGSVDLSGFSLPTQPIFDDDYSGYAVQMEKNPYSGTNSYMAIMANMAEETEGLVEAVVYLIMVWQFIMLIVIYYKRVFMVAFLVVIFPLVALSYALDKVADHRSQAFDTWTREIMTNIFVQSIHAIVYVFVLGATFASGQYSGDWLLTIVGISFLFQAEQILKKIIGQEGSTVRGLGDTAKRTLATVVATKAVASSVADNLIGAKSHLGKTINYYRKFRAEDMKARNMDFLTKTNTPPPAPPRTFNPNLTSNSVDYDDLSSAVQTVNNHNHVNPDVLAGALDQVMKNIGSSDPNVQAIMKGLNLTDQQLQALSDLQQFVVDSVVDGDRSTPEKYAKLKETIDHDLDIHLQAIFPGDKERRDLIKRALYFRMRDGDKSEKHKVRSTNRIEVKKEMDQAFDKRLSFADPLGLWSFKDELQATPLKDKARSTADFVLATHFKAENGRYADNDVRMAESIAIVKDLSRNAQWRYNNKGVKQSYTAGQSWKAVKYIAEHENDSKENRMAVRAALDGITGEEAKAIIAEHMARTYVDTTGNPMNFREEKARGIKVNATDGKAMQRKLTENTVKNVMEEVLEYIQREDDKAGEKLCYDETLDKFSVKDILRRERIIQTDDEKRAYDEAYVDYVISEREARNKDEITWVENFAREQLDDTPDIYGETYDGLSKEEHEAYSKDLKKKFMEELARTSMTTTGVVLGGLIGTGVEIGLSDDKPILEEAMIGAGAGIFVGDTIAENIIGREDNTRRVSIINPYTGVVEQFDLRTTGASREGIALEMIGKGEVITADDPRIIGFKYDLDRKFLENKAKSSKEVKKKVSVYNPQTRKVEEIELKRYGVSRDGYNLEDIAKGEILDSNDPRISGFKAEVDKQLMESKIEYDQKMAQRKNTYSRKLGNQNKKP